MGDTKVDIRKEDWEIYLSCVDALKIKIQWVPSTSASIYEELSALANFFLQPQTNKTRQGILLLLNAMQDYEEYAIFLTLCEELLKVQVKISEKEYYTFFHFLFECPEKIHKLLYCVNSIYFHFKDNTHKILISLFHIGSYVIEYPNHRENMQKCMEFFIRRTNNFLRGMQKIQQQLQNFCYQLQEFLHISGNRMLLPPNSDMQGTILHKHYYQLPYLPENIILFPTDGDMHCGGKMPYFVTYSEKKFVYKPRNMQVDFFITEALAFFTNFLEEDFRLPILGICLFEDATGIMDFATHVKEMTQEEASSYFFKFGALLCFMNLFHIEDIHYENMMATAQGPVLIDLECSFHFALTTKKGIFNAPLRDLREAFSGNKLENATFFVNGAILPLTAWKEQICNGFSEAARCLWENKIAFLEYYINLLHRTFYKRIVPVKTGDFYTYMYSAIYYTPDITNLMLDDICGIIMKTLQDFNITQEDVKINILKENIYNSFFWGDIPYFQLKITVDENENLCCTGYIDTICFFKKPVIINSVNFFIQQFEETIDWLCEGNAIEQLEKFIDGK